MATRKEVEAQIAALTASLEDADTDDEIWIKDDSGREVKVTGKRATSVLNRFADLWADDKAGDDGDDGDDKPDPKPESTSFFKGKR